MTRNGVLPRLLTGAAVLLSAGLLVACSADTTPTSAPTEAPAGGDDTLKSELPAEFQDGINVGLTSNTPPLIFKDENGEDVGMDREIVEALEPIIGVPLNWESVQFQDMLLGLESGKYDFVVATTINNPRKEKFDQLQYFTSSTSFGSLASAPDVGKELTDVCGMTIGVVSGNNVIPFVEETINPGCTDAGLEPVVMNQYPNFDAVYLNVASGNVQLALVDTASFGFMMESTEGAEFRFNGPQNLMLSPSGMSFLKSNNALALVVQKALVQLIESGEYDEILARWGQTSSGITADQAVLNPPTEQ